MLALTHCKAAMSPSDIVHTCLPLGRADADNTHEYQPSLQCKFQLCQLCLRQPAVNSVTVKREVRCFLKHQRATNHSLEPQLCPYSTVSHPHLILEVPMPSLLLPLSQLPILCKSEAPLRAHYQKHEHLSHH